MIPRYPFENDDLDPEDDVPVQVFWEGNEGRIADHVDNVRDMLRDAKKVRALRLFVRRSKTLVLSVFFAGGSFRSRANDLDSKLRRLTEDALFFFLFFHKMFGRT